MNKKHLIPIFSVLLVVAACASLKLNLSEKQFSIWANNVYNNQYQEYLSHFETNAAGTQVLKSNVSEDRKAILKRKKEIMSEVHPLLLAYGIYAQSGEWHEEQTLDYAQQRIVSLINQLVEED